MQTTLIILKPDAVQRGLMGTILNRFERKGLRIVGMKLIMVSQETATEHYAEHHGKPFYDNLIKFVTRSPVLVMAIAGIDAIAVCRRVIGSTNCRSADPGTIRGDFGMSSSFNMVHGSDSLESAKRELKLWFKDGEILDAKRTSEQWVIAESDYTRS